MVNAKTKKPQDFVIATGKQYTVKSFIDNVAKKLDMKIFWKGKGINEKAVDDKGRIIVACSKTYYRPLEVNSLLGDARKARKLLKWSPKINLDRLIEDMIEVEMDKISFL